MLSIHEHAVVLIIYEHAFPQPLGVIPRPGARGSTLANALARARGGARARVRAQTRTVGACTRVSTRTHTLTRVHGGA